MKFQQQFSQQQKQTQKVGDDAEITAVDPSAAIFIR